MTQSDWAGIIYSYTFVSAAVLSALWFIAKKAIHHVLEEKMMELKDAMAPVQELRHNGGSSIKDAVTQIRECVVDIQLNVAKLEGKFEQHLKENE